ncbi:winged helix-turn-helix transcriptional regulator [Streptococcus hyovaginalis]
MIHGRGYSKVPQKGEYFRTEVGMILVGIVEMMDEWGKNRIAESIKEMEISELNN